ncbi:MAG: serine/threonine protein kinase, partial [Myxococcales bacterium]|nr:serine/threonine protein kinase [Myxococcales bacterium]
MSNRRIGRYELGEELGSGGMGVVYSATDTVLSNTVAVKVLRPHEDQASNAVERFEREARATAKLGHPNIVRVMDMGRTDDGGAYLVMEQLQGETLDDILAREGPLSVERAVRIHLQLLDALTAAHEAGVLHRDVKPSNVFVSTLADGTELVKLLDFGLAYLMEEAASKRLTATGIAMGTPAYMSPERITGDSLDHRADIYSVGVSLYRSLTNELPFHADTPIALRGRILLVEAPMLSETRPDLSGTIADVVAKSLAKKPDDRFATAREMAKSLSEALDHVRPSLAKIPPKAVGADIDRDAPTVANTRPAGAEAEHTREIGETGADDEPSEDDRPSEPRGWKAATIRGHGALSLPEDEEPEPKGGGSKERPPTLPLGGVSVPPNRAIEAPRVSQPDHVAPPAKPGTPAWMIGLAIGAAVGAVLLLGLYLWHRSQTTTTSLPPPVEAPPVEAPPEPPPAP